MDKTGLNPSLDDLMRAAQAGDKRAYAALFKAMTPILRAFISRRLSSHADAEDVLQNTLLSIHNAGHTYDSDRPFKIWMFAIARHRLTDYLREKYRKGGMATVDIDSAAFENLAQPVTDDRDTREYLEMVLDTLPDRQRKIITMMKVEGYSAAEVAKAMNMSVSAVKVAAHRAYKALALKAERMD